MANVKFDVLNNQGQLLYRADEQSNACQRDCIPASRGCTIYVKDLQGGDLLVLNRDGRYCACCFPCCCLPAVVVEAPPGHLIGKIQEDRTFYAPSFTIRDECDATIYKISTEQDMTYLNSGDIQFRVRQNIPSERSFNSNWYRVEHVSVFGWFMTVNEAIEYSSVFDLHHYPILPTGSGCRFKPADRHNHEATERSYPRDVCTCDEFQLIVPHASRCTSQSYTTLSFDLLGELGLSGGLSHLLPEYAVCRSHHCEADRHPSSLLQEQFNLDSTQRSRGILSRCNGD